MYVFMYGTLMRGFGNNRLLTGGILVNADRGPVAQFIGEATTVSRFMMRDVGFPYIKFSRGADSYPVRGELWDIGNPIKDSDARVIRDALDRLEGVNGAYPKSGHYARECFAVRTDDGTKYKVYLYHATDRTWERVGYAPNVKPNSKGLLDWGELHQERRRPLHDARPPAEADRSAIRG